MENNSFISKLIRLIKRGSKGSRLDIYMIRNRIEWSDFGRKDVVRIIEEIKFHPLAVYAFIPFFYRILGIDLFDYYIKMNGIVWKDERANRIIELFEKYPIQIYKEELEYLDSLGLSLSSFSSVRKNLIEEGFKGVDRIKVVSEDTWIDFDFPVS